MKYLKRFNESKEIWFEDSLIDNIESILIELKDNDIPFNIRIMPARNAKSYKEIVIDFGDPYTLNTLSSDKFLQDGKIKDYINESFKTLIDYVKELGFFIYLYVSHRNGGSNMNINYIIDSGWREFSYIKSFKIVISKTKVNIN